MTVATETDNPATKAKPAAERLALGCLAILVIGPAALILLSMVLAFPSFVRDLMADATADPPLIVDRSNGELVELYQQRINQTPVFHLVDSIAVRSSGVVIVLQNAVGPKDKKVRGEIVQYLANAWTEVGGRGPLHIQTRDGVTIGGILLTGETFTR